MSLDQFFFSNFWIKLISTVAYPFLFFFFFPHDRLRVPVSFLIFNHFSLQQNPSRLQPCQIPLYPLPLHLSALITFHLSHLLLFILPLVMLDIPLIWQSKEASRTDLIPLPSSLYSTCNNNLCNANVLCKLNYIVNTKNVRIILAKPLWWVGGCA